MGTGSFVFYYLFFIIVSFLIYYILLRVNYQNVYQHEQDKNHSYLNKEKYDLK